MSVLTQYQDRLLTAYTNFPLGRFVSLILVRKTESEALFRTEGVEGDLSKDFVRAGAEDSAIIQRVVMTKRKQTAVERRTGREIPFAYRMEWNAIEGRDQAYLAWWAEASPGRKAAYDLYFGTRTDGLAPQTAEVGGLGYA